MNLRAPISLFFAGTLALLATGCSNPPGKPQLNPEEQARPSQILDSATLYKKNCAACHGNDGLHAAAISLNNPVYLAIAGEANITRAVAVGIPGTLMPAFSKSAGGMLTDQQIASLVHGMLKDWGRPLPAGVLAPPYASATAGNQAAGEKSFATFCATCHGEGGTGNGKVGSVVDPAYLALVNDQYLRSNILAGKPDYGMPDWSAHNVGGVRRPMTDAEITDIVAWLASHRIATPGQPYQQHQ